MLNPNAFCRHLFVVSPRGNDERQAGLGHGSVLGCPPQLPWHRPTDRPLVKQSEPAPRVISILAAVKLFASLTGREPGMLAFQIYIGSSGPPEVSFESRSCGGTRRPPRMRIGQRMDLESYAHAWHLAIRGKAQAERFKILEGQRMRGARTSRNTKSVCRVGPSTSRPTR